MFRLYGDADMKNYITIDGGTTNTRVSLVKGEEIVKTIKLAVGARVGIDNKKLLVSDDIAKTASLRGIIKIYECK